MVWIGLTKKNLRFLLEMQIDHLWMDLLYFVTLDGGYWMKNTFAWKFWAHKTQKLIYALKVKIVK